MVRLQIDVIDSGIGIAEELREKLFDSFTQGDGIITKKYGGSGLGLTITKQLVTLMNGDISLESTPGKGSTFTCTIELEEGDEEEREKSSKNVIAEFPGIRVLIVEDNALNKEAARLHLEKAKIRVDEVSSGFEALEILAHQKYDLIFMDIQMPSMDGLETTRKIRALGVNTPIIALSENVLGKDHRKSLESGMQAHLNKPFRPEEIFALIGEFVKPAQKPKTPTLTWREKLQEIKGISPSSELEEIWLDFETYHQKLERFAKTGGNDIYLIKILLERNDYEKIEEILHTLKGICRLFGATELLLRVETLSKAIENGSIKELDALYTLLVQEFEVLASQF